MNSPFGWLLLVVAAAATAVALWAGPNLPIAGPAAAVAVLAAGLVFAFAWLDRPDRRPVPPSPPPDRDVFLFRYGFHSGRLGREEIVSTLDRIERMGPTPNLYGRTPGEIDSIVSLSGSEFREYVRTRLDDLEVRT
jgi:hypothetical protein